MRDLSLMRAPLPFPAPETVISVDFPMLRLHPLCQDDGSLLLLFLNSGPASLLAFLLCPFGLYFLPMLYLCRAISVL